MPTTSRAPAVERISANELIARLEVLRRRCAAALPATIVFDADGTLWRVDVGEDLFAAAIERQAIREPARAALTRLAQQQGIDIGGTPTELAARLAGAYKAGLMIERLYAEMLVWCYAGWRHDEWFAFARAQLPPAYLQPQFFAPSLEILDWARARGIRSVVVSASPQAAVVAGAAALGIDAREIFAGQPAQRGEILSGELASPLPWGEHKVSAARAALGESAWLATLGDSAFDIAMMLAALQPVAVRPKPELRARFGEFAALPLVELREAQDA